MYLASNGAWVNTDADGEGSASGMIGYALGSSSATNGVMLQGIIYKQSHGFTTGAPLFLSTTAGAMTNTAPTGSGDIIRVVGYAIGSNQIYFDPAKTWVEKT